jgi:hypothetical protein
MQRRSSWAGLRTDKVYSRIPPLVHVFRHPRGSVYSGRFSNLTISLHCSLSKDSKSQKLLRCRYKRLAGGPTHLQITCAVYLITKFGSRRFALSVTYFVQLEIKIEIVQVRSQDVSIGISTDSGLDSRDSIPARTRDFFFTPQCLHRLWNPSSPLSTFLEGIIIFLLFGL